MTARSKKASLPEERTSITHQFTLGDEKGYVTASFFPDGSAAELMITMGKNGATGRALLNAVAELATLALQAGVPLEEIAGKMEHTMFEPNGLTRNKAIPHATSVLDYVFKWMRLKEGAGRGR